MALVTMTVAALGTSVAINVCLCAALMLLYSLLSRQRCNAAVYIPRWESTPIEQQLQAHPSSFWILEAFRVPDDAFISLAGFDAYVFLRVFVFSLRVFTVAAIVCLFILLPINYDGNQLRHSDISDLANQSLDLFTIANVENGSKWLWAHFCALYFLTGVTCILLYMEYKDISMKRFEHLNSSPPQPQHFSILLRDVPHSKQHSMSETVEMYFREYYSSSYLSHHMVYRTGRLQKLKDESEALFKKVLHLKSISDSHSKHLSAGSAGLLSKKSESINVYSEKLKDVQEKLRVGQSEIHQGGKELPAAFVSFRTRYDAAVAAQILRSVNPLLWVASLAPEPRDVSWSFLSASYIQLWISKIVVLVAALFLTVVFIFVVTFVQGLVQLASLEKFFPFLTGILKIKIISDVVTGYLPSLILKVFLYAVPSIMMLFSEMQGSVSLSSIQRSACTKVLYFTIWNVFFATVLSGSAFTQIETFISNPRDIPRQLAVVVPGQATFFITYVLTSGWTGLALEITRIFALLGNIFSRLFSGGNNNNANSAPLFCYHRDIPEVLLFGLLGFTYCLLAPLILPFLLVYFFAGYIFYRNQLLKVYMPKFETDGKFWPIVHSCTIFSLILMQIILLGIFTIKELPMAALWTGAGILMTLLFNDYCRRRFLPLFEHYPAEVLIKKDKEDESNLEMMAQFFEDLRNAYLDPALRQIRYLPDEKDERTSLLSSYSC